MKENRIPINPRVVVDLDFAAQIESSAPPFGRRFAATNREGRIDIYDGPEITGGFHLEGYEDASTSAGGFAVALHPEKELLAVYPYGDEENRSSEVVFFDFKGIEKHRFQYPSHIYSRFIVGFTNAGDFFYAGLTEFVSREITYSDLPQNEIVVWAAEESLGRIGDFGNVSIRKALPGKFAPNFRTAPQNSSTIGLFEFH